MKRKIILCSSMAILAVGSIVAVNAADKKTTQANAFYATAGGTCREIQDLTQNSFSTTGTNLASIIPSTGPAVRLFQQNNNGTCQGNLYFKP